MNVDYDVLYENYIKRALNIQTPQIILQSFCSHLNKNDFVLDVGCGIADDSARISKWGLKVCCVDISKKLISFAKKKVPELEFILMDARNLSFSDKFNGIWCRQVLHHYELRETEKIISDFHKLLFPNGILYFSVLIGDGVIEKTIDGILIRKYQYKFEDIIKMVTKNNFKIYKLIIESYNLKWLNVFCTSY